MGESTSSSSPTAFERWRKSLVDFTGLGLSPEEVSAREQSKGADFARAQRQACLLWRNDLLRSSTRSSSSYHLKFGVLAFVLYNLVL